MKERFRQAFASITPPRSDEALYDSVLQQESAAEEKPRRKIASKAILIPLAAVLGCMVFTMSAGAIYEGFQYLRGELVDGQTSTAEHIQSDVFFASTEHLTLAVEELISDGQVTYAILHYHALDDRGTELLNHDGFLPDDNPNRLNQCPRMESSYQTSFAYGTAEIDYLRKKTDRYFILQLELSEVSLDATDQEVRLYYTLDGAITSAALNITDLLERRVYQLECLGEEPEGIDVNYLVVSDLSYMVCGSSELSPQEREEMVWGNSILLLGDDPYYDPEDDWVNAYREDYISVGNGFAGGLEEPFADGSNLVLAGGAFFTGETIYEKNFRIPRIDSTQVSGLIFADAEYRLVPME